MTNVLSTTDLAAILAEQNGTTKKAAKETVDSVLSLIASSLAEGNTVRMAGFGSLEVVDVAERNGRNPQTGEALVIPATKRVKFKVASALKEAVKGQ